MTDRQWWLFILLVCAALTPVAAALLDDMGIVANVWRLS
jgi:hypothetical protein